MNCFFATNHLSAYFDGKLVADQVAELEAHLTTCAPCRQQKVEVESVREKIREMPLLEAPLAIRARVRLLTLGERLRVPLRQRRFLLGCLAALVLVFALLLGGKSWIERRLLGEQIASGKSVAVESRALPETAPVMRPSQGIIEKPAPVAPAATETKVETAPKAETPKVPAAPVRVSKILAVGPAQGSLEAAKERILEACSAVKCQPLESGQEIEFTPGPSGEILAVRIPVSAYRTLLTRLRNFGKITGSLFDAKAHDAAAIVELRLALQVAEPPTESTISEEEKPDGSPEKSETSP